MSPSAEVVQCPYCLGRRRIKQDGTFYDHDRGRAGVLKRCPGAGKTPEAARVGARAASWGDPDPSVQSGQPDSIQPEDIF